MAEIPDEKIVSNAEQPSSPASAAPAAPEQPSTPPPKEEGKEPKRKPDEEVLSEFTSRFLGKTEKKKEAADPDDKPGKEEKPEPEGGKDEGKPKAAPAKKEAPKKPAAQKPAPVTVPDYDKIAAAAAEGATRALTAAKTASVQGAVKLEKRELPSAEQRKIATLRVMEERYPDKYKGLADKYENSVVAGLEYADKWERENPGEKFADDDPEHEEFFQQHDIEWEDDDYVEARAELLVRPQVEEATRQVSTRLEEFERKERTRELLPVIDLHQAKAAKRFMSKIDPAYGELINEKTGGFDKAAHEKLTEADPMTMDIVTEHASKIVEPLAGEILRLYEGVSTLDLKRPDHNMINWFALEEEKHMVSLPAEQQVRDGKQFMPASDYHRLPKAEQGNFWTFTANDLSERLADQIAVQAQKAMENEAKRVARWSKSKRVTLAGAPGTRTAPAAENNEPDDDKPVSPSTASEPKMAREVAGASLDDGKPLSTFMSGFLGQR